MRAWLVNFVLATAAWTAWSGLVSDEAWSESIPYGVMFGVLMATVAHWRRWNARRPGHTRRD